MPKQPAGSAADFSQKRRALFVTPENPFPTIGGGALRSASLLTYLAKHFAVDVVTFRQPGAPDPRATFPPGMAASVQVIDLPYHPKSAGHRIARNLTRAFHGRPPLIDRYSGFETEVAAAVQGRHYEIGFLEHFWCASYERLLRPHCTRVVLDLHNIESIWHAALARTERRDMRWLYRRFETVCARMEKALLPRFDHTLVTSHTDASHVARIAPGVPTTVYPNAIPYYDRPAKQERHVVVFTGNLEYQPNRSAIFHFRDRIWPDLRQRWPTLIWEIIGKNPQSLHGIGQGDLRIHLIGPVDDAIARIASAQVAVVPLLAGSGTRIKILEAWAAATPVVSTTIGAEGLHGCEGEELLIADRPAGFADAVHRLLSDPVLRTRIGNAGRKRYEDEYSWEQAWMSLDKILKSTGAV